MDDELESHLADRLKRLRHNRDSRRANTIVVADQDAIGRRLRSRLLRPERDEQHRGQQ